jgi:hypothetical protein
MSTSQCYSCQMEFQIDVRELDTRRTAVIITRWANLGSGTTPLTPTFNIDSHGYHGAAEGQFTLGSIRSAFEGQDGLSLVEFTEDNKYKLLLERQRGLRTRYGWTWLPRKSQWYLQATKAREEPRSLVGSARRWCIDWLQLTF